MNIEDLNKKEIYYDELTVVTSKTKSFDIWILSKGLELNGIHKEGILTLLNENGFVKRSVANGITYSRITENLIVDVSIDEIKDFVRDKVWSIEHKLEVFASKKNTEVKTIQVSQFREVFLNNQHFIFNTGFLSNLKYEHRNILRDTKEIAYLVFKNTVVRINSSGISLVDHSEIREYLIFKSQIIDVEFAFEQDWTICEFAKFIKNIANNNKERKDTIRSAIGYLLHGYNDPTNTQAVLLYDEELTNSNTPKGGTGKGLIAKAISQVSKGLVPIDGKGVNLKSPFLFQQIKEDTRVVFIDDVTKSFDFDRLNSALTEGINVEKKFKPIVHISKEEMPKFLIASNIILAFDGTTRIRRQYIVQLSNYYSKKLKEGIEQPVHQEHKGIFFSNDWSNVEWNVFYCSMIKCIEFYLKNGLVKAPVLNMKINYLIQKIGNDLLKFFDDMKFQKDTEYLTKPLYEEFKNDYYQDEEYSQRKFSDNLSLYLTYNGFHFEFKKGRLFIKA